MGENQSACFRVDRDIDGDLSGYRNDILIWATYPSTQNAYCFSGGNESKGIIAKFRVKELKEQIGLL